MSVPESTMARGEGISLIGYRASGKSTIARQVADLLGREFFDVDREIESRTGQPIASLFRDEGEEGFRDREQSVLEELCRDHPGSVLATGGGVVLRPANRETLRRFGLVVWLKAPVSTLVDRLRITPGDRPSLTGAGLLDEVEAVLKLREPLYRDLADRMIDTSLGDPEQVAKTIAEMMSGGEARP